MNNQRRRWRQMSISAVLLLTLMSATFASGYRSGYQQSGDYQFQELIRLIETTVVPETWEALGGPSTMAPYPQNISCTISCNVEVVDHMASQDDCELLLSTDDSDQLDSVSGDAE